MSGSNIFKPLKVIPYCSEALANTVKLFIVQAMYCKNKVCRVFIDIRGWLLLRGESRLPLNIRVHDMIYSKISKWFVWEITIGSPVYVNIYNLCKKLEKS